MEERVITMPVVALRGLTILPGMVQHFDVNRPRSVAAVEKAMIGDQKLFLVSQRHPEIPDPELKDLYQVGTIGVVKQLVKLPGKTVRVLVEGLERAELLDFDSQEPCLIGEISSMEPEQEDADDLAKEAMVRFIRALIREDLPTLDLPAKANSGSVFSGRRLVTPHTVSRSTDLIIMQMPPLPLLPCF